MNLPEYYSMVLDELETAYKGDAHVDNPDLQRYFLEECEDGNESYIILEALDRLKEIAALRKVLKIHNTWSVVYGSSNFCSLGCEGCGLDGSEEMVTPYINDCPTLLALVEPYSDRPDFRTWS